MDNKPIDFVNVSLRIRPALNQDSISTSCLQVISKQPPILLVVDRSQTYHFDKIFTEEADQQTVYNETVKPLVEYVKRGYNCTVFAYGQTGTGKTYTMGTSSRIYNEDAGLIPRALRQFFEADVEDGDIDISVSFIEIYNERVFDLLQDSNKHPLRVKGFKVQGFRQVKVFNCNEAKELLKIGNKNRHTAGTKQNSNSSRSHAVFTIYCNVKYSDRERCAKLNLVDLAGCESVRKTGNQGSTFQEGVNINKGLLCIGQVMTALSSNSNFIPYRQSIITIILQDSLNTKNFISLIACVNSNVEDSNETVQTLDFAQRVKKMKNKPEISEAITQYKRNNPYLFQTPKVNNTAFKRPASVQQTPCPMKRIKNVHMKTINGLPGPTNSTESPTSMTMSSIYSNAEVTQQNLSPVIKKYINAMESSLMNKLETVIKNTLKRPMIESQFEADRNANKENTPKLSWNKIQNEVSRLVRHEIVQFSAIATRAASSPIDDYLESNKIKRVLNYDSPVLDDNLEKEDSQNKDGGEGLNVKSSLYAEFKVPECPVFKPKTKKANQAPVEFVSRRSLRLSLKRKTVNDNYSIEESDMSLEVSCDHEKEYLQSGRKQLKDDTIEMKDNNTSQFGRRYSIRLAESKNELEDECHTQNKSNMTNDGIDENNKSQCTRRYSVRLMKKTYDGKYAKQSKEDIINDNNNARDLDVNVNDMSLIKTSLILDLNSKNRVSNVCSNCNVPNTKNNRRYSVRLAKKEEKCQLHTGCVDDSFVQGYKKKETVTCKPKTTKLKVIDTCVGKRVVQNNSGSDSPITARTKYVLNMLNDGNTRQLEQLHSIGPKTAQQILLFRDIKGKFANVSDLSKMPGWQGSKFEKFMAQNFLKKEII